MLRRILGVLLPLALLAGCAGSARLTERSQQKLANGDVWRAWQLATRALDREPMNPKARAAATAAGAAISQDWQRRIRALAELDSVRAAEQVLAFVDFRGNAARYATIDVGPAWPADERALRRAAARSHYDNGKLALSARRPRAAYDHFRDCERYVTGYRDAVKLGDAAFDQALTRVAVLPFASASGDDAFAREVTDHWRDALAEQLAPPRSRFTRMLGAEAVNSRMTVSQLNRLSREGALMLGRKAGAQRIVWGSLGAVRSETNLQFFRDRVARRIVQKDTAGHETTRWVEVPIEVVARVRDVSVDVDYEVIATRDGATLAHARTPVTSRARVLWTSYLPEGDPASYALVSQQVRDSDPTRAKDMEARWKTTCGESTTLAQVLAARRETRGDAGYERGVLGRFMTGAAFVFLQELPPADDLALAALREAWQPLQRELARLDAVDDVELGVAATDSDR